jgi:hypothetical protein
MSLIAPETEPAGAARPTAPTARPTPDPFIGAISVAAKTHQKKPIRKKKKKKKTDQK